MSTAQKQQQPAQTVRPAAAPKKPAKPVQEKKEQTFLFDRDNYILMTIGIALIFIGFQIMSGGKSPDPNKFNYDEIFSFRRITLAPVLVLLGYVVEVFAIIKKPKDTAPLQTV